jgi:hypothetical protein
VEDDPVLGMKKYANDYIAACRARVDADLFSLPGRGLG